MKGQQFPFCKLDFGHNLRPQPDVVVHILCRDLGLQCRQNKQGRTGWGALQPQALQTGSHEPAHKSALTAQGNGPMDHSLQCADSKGLLIIAFRACSE